MTLGKRIKLLLNFKGIEQKRLAEEIGVSQTMVCRWVKDLNRPTYDNMVLVANFLHITFEELVGVSPTFDELLIHIDSRLL